MGGDIGLEGESRNNVTLGHLCHHLLVRTRSSHWRCYVRKGVLRNFAKFTGKHLRQSLVYQPETCNIYKKETLAQQFSREFCEISENTFFTEHLLATASAATLVKNILAVLFQRF